VSVGSLQDRVRGLGHGCGIVARDLYDEGLVWCLWCGGGGVAFLVDRPSIVFVSFEVHLIVPSLEVGCCVRGTLYRVGVCGGGPVESLEYVSAARG